MNRIRTLRILAAVACSVSFTVPAFGQSKHWEELQDLPFRENYPTADSTERLYDEMLFHRSTQVLQWSLPAMTLWAMKKGSEKQFGEGSHVFPIWKDRLTSDTLVSTPNCDVIYGMGYLDLKKDGPTVIEVPPKLQGMLDDFWHRPLCDVGFVGPDKGEGGKYLILPPDHEGETPEGYFTFKSRTYNVFVFWRAFRDKGGDTKQAVALMEKTRIYPLSKKGCAAKNGLSEWVGTTGRHAVPERLSVFRGIGGFH